jgi:hypothetical protein
MHTVLAIVDFLISPTSRLSLRASLRHFGLDNNTPQANWRYVTSDTSNLNGTILIRMSARLAPWPPRAGERLTH